MLDQIIVICQDLLKNYYGANQVREYLNSRISPGVQEEFEVGYFPTPENLNLITDIIEEKKLLESELFYYRITEGDKVLASTLENHNMILPYKDAYGKIIGIVGRTILSDDEFKLLKISKYKNTSFPKKNHLFGLHIAKQHIIKEDCVYVVEGQFDCIRAISSGIKNCVCLGSGNITFNQFAILTRYTNNIIMMLDNDIAGKTGMDKAIATYGSKANIKKIILPEGYKDLDQFIVSEGKNAIEFVKNLT